jgi:hypothetical protein
VLGCSGDAAASATMEVCFELHTHSLPRRIHIHAKHPRLLAVVQPLQTLVTMLVCLGLTPPQLASGIRFVYVRQDTMRILAGKALLRVPACSLFTIPFFLEHLCTFLPAAWDSVTVLHDCSSSGLLVPFGTVKNAACSQRPRER